MEKSSESNPTMLMWVLLLCLVSQTLVIPVACRSLEGVADQKTYYPPDPHRSHSPTHSHASPPCATPSTPSHGTPSTPSHGGGYGTPTAPSHGGGYGTPSTPPAHGGGYYNPPTYHHPPSTPVVTPTPPSVPYIDPGTPAAPGISTPPSPLLPGTPPFTCDYWRTHPALIWGIFGYWAPMSGIFGVACTTAFGQNLNLPQALSNTRMDGVGALYREGTASLLNAMVSRSFPFTTQQVRDAFMSAIISDHAAAKQAKLFRQANEGH